MSHRRYCCPVTCLAETTLVSATTGSDRCGQINSADHPFRTIDAAARATSAGSHLYLESGVYRLSESLLNKSVYAGVGVTLEMESAEALDGMVALEGYATLVIAKPIEGIRLGAANSNGSTQLNFISMVDAASTRATFIMWKPDKQAVTITVRDYIESTANNTALFDLLGPSGPGKIIINVQDAVHKSGGAIVNSKDVDYEFIAAQVLTSTTAFRVVDGHVKMTVEQVGAPDALVETALDVSSSDLTMENEFRLGRVYARNGAVVAGGHNQITIEECGTVDWPVWVGANILGVSTNTSLKIERLIAQDTGVQITTAPEGSRISTDIHLMGLAELPMRQGIVIIHDFSGLGTAGSSVTAVVDRMHAYETGVEVRGNAPQPLAVILDGHYHSLEVPPSAPVVPRRLIAWGSLQATGNVSVNLFKALGPDSRIIELANGELKIFGNEMMSEGDIGHVDHGKLEIVSTAMTAAGTAIVASPDADADVSVNASRAAVYSWFHVEPTPAIPQGVFTLKSVTQQLQTTSTAYRIPYTKEVDLSHSATSITSATDIMSSQAAGIIAILAREITAAAPDAAFKLAGPATVTLSGVISNTLGGIVSSSGLAALLNLRAATLICPTAALSYALGLAAQLNFMDGNQTFTYPAIDPNGAMPTIGPRGGQVFDNLEVTF